ncbi:molybdopterin-binding protein [Agromyces soli]
MGFHRIAMQPGKPQAFGTIGDGTPVFGLPGNPGAVAVSFELFVRPALLRLQGCALLHRPRFAAVVAEGWRAPMGRTQLAPVVFVRGTGDAGADAASAAVIRVRPANRKGSASQTAGDLDFADGYAIVPPGTGELRPGDVVEVFAVGS